MHIDWQAIDTLLLDMDGTLLDLHFDNYFWVHYLPQRYIETFKLEPTQTLAYLEQLFADQQGSLSWYCIDYWSDQLQLDIVALKKEVKDKIAIRPFVEDFLSAMRQTGKKTILITNAHRASLDLKMEETALTPYLDALASTHDYGKPKEDPRLWSDLQSDFKYDPARSLLIDDGEVILDCAKACSIGHLLTLKQPDSQKALRKNLRHPAILHFDEIMPNV